MDLLCPDFVGPGRPGEAGLVGEQLRLAEADDESGGVVVVLAPVLDDAPRHRLRRPGQTRLQVAPRGDAVAHQAVDVPRPHGHAHHLGGAHVVAHDAGQGEAARRMAVERLHLDVADAAELALARGVHLEQADGGAAGDAQLLMAAPEDGVHGLIRELADDLRGTLGGHRRLVAVAEPVDHGGQNGAVALLDDEAVATDRKALVRAAETTGFQRSPRKMQLTVVPTPGRVSSWNSSTSFLTATSPLPMPRCDL